VRLEGHEPHKKVNVIKVVREVTGIGLKEAKDLVEGPPAMIRQGVSPAEAREIANLLSAAGGRVSVLPAPDSSPPRGVSLLRNVWLEGHDPARKINVIKAVRELTGLGLKEAKDLVELPSYLFAEGVSAAEAERLVRHLEAAGARVSSR
jgi:ribosomal protein L7/L12